MNLWSGSNISFDNSNGIIQILFVNKSCAVGLWQVEVEQKQDLRVTLLVGWLSVSTHFDQPVEWKPLHDDVGKLVET